MIYFTFFLSFFSVVFLTPIVKILAKKINATDKPSERKVHQKEMPRLGGIAIYFGFLTGLTFFQPYNEHLMSILVGSLVIVILGICDDLYQVSAKWKLLIQIIASLIVVVDGIYVEFINLPFEGQLYLGWFGLPLTILWIVGVTNAINLIDGLDGLAAGVSSIVLMSLCTIAFIMGNWFVVLLCVTLMASALGFLVYNFFPAKIFMGDTGALFLGYMIAIISLLGFKNVTLFSLLIPVVILGVPLSDTFFAIVRRLVHKTPLTMADKSHLHHCLLRLGFSHRQTVMLIYAMSAVFGIGAIVLTHSTLWGALIVVLVLIIGIEIIVEVIGLVHATYKPMLTLMKRIVTMIR